MPGTCRGFRTYLASLFLLSTSFLASCSHDGGYPSGPSRYYPPEIQFKPVSTGLPVSTPGEQGFDTVALKEAYRFVGRDADLKESMLSLLVVRHGYLVAEKYFHGDGPDTPFNVMSVSKSFLSALAGIAIDQGDLAGVDQPIAPFFAEYLGPDPGPPLSDITVRHLLTHTAGFRWEETGESAMAWENSADWNAYFLARPIDDEPGTTFNYSTAGTHLLATLLARATGRPLMDFAQQELFQPTGIQISRWDTDPQGNYYGGGQMYFRPIDLAKFGVLFMDGGVYDGVQVVPESWVEESTKRLLSLPDGTGYGYLWWRDVAAGRDYYFAAGYGGQYIFVAPDVDVVVVVTSAIPNYNPHYYGAVEWFVASRILAAAM